MHPDRPTGAFAQFRTGFAFFRSGVTTVITQTHLWPYVFIPAVLTVTALVGAVVGTWMVIDWLTASMWTAAAGSSFAWQLFLYVVQWTVRILVVMAFSLAAYLVAGLVAVPFNDRLSNDIELQVLGPVDEAFDLGVMIGDLLMSLRHTLAGLLLWAVLMSLLFLLNLVPGVGSVLGTIGSVFVSCLLLSRETMDGCMSRRRLAFMHKLRIVRANLWLCVGLGFGAWLCMWVPLMNFLVLPMAVAGGTRMFCWLELEGMVPNEAGDGALKVERQAG